MLDSLTIFSKGGLVLYQFQSNDPTIGGGRDESSSSLSSRSEELLNEFLSSTLLSPTRLTKTQSTKRTTLATSAMSSSSSISVVAEWETQDDWIAVALYPEVALRRNTAWIRQLLQSVLKEYSLFHGVKTAKDPAVLVPDGSIFDGTFKALLRQAEALGRKETTPELLLEDETDGDTTPAQQDEDDEEEPVNTQKGIEKVTRQRGRHQTTTTTMKGGEKTTSKKKGKDMTVWHDGTAKITKEALAQLDRSKDGGGVDGIEASVADNSRALAEARAAYLPSTEEIPSWEEEDQLNDDDDDDDDTAQSSSSGWGSSLKGLFDQMSGNKVLTKEDLEAPLADMQRMLTCKNVANEIASEICDGVRAKLVGRRMQSFQRVKTAVRQALESAIKKILQPANDVDMLRAIVTKRERGSGFFRSSSNGADPYVIVFVGINGVGKSTSLAKVAYYLKMNDCNPMLAACDTFRSGAVEQLNVHAKCLEVPLYHKGYAKDPSAVAKEAIAHAKQEKHDVVLVDTAGRMQNNVPLMKALSKLVVENKPDLVLFVCEALVGNDGIDQLTMFNKALRSGGHSRQIDGIILTKFDTVSDKVGAALTMTHITGAPVVFIGTGQKYNHLKKLSPQSVIKSLFA